MALIIAFRNISQLAEVSDYEYGVYINDRLIEKGKVTEHMRSDGWPALVTKLLQQREAHSLRRTPEKGCRKCDGTGRIHGPSTWVRCDCGNWQEPG